MQPIQIKHLYIYVSIFFTLLTFSTFAQDNIPELPKIQTSVYDYAHMLSKVEKEVLEQKLIKYNDTTSTQIVVATIKSLNGNDIALFATNWAHKWEIGQKGKDNGVFVLVAKNDRKITIRSGYGVEHKLTDAYSKRIIEQVIKPEFKKGKFYRGLDRGTTYIIEILNGEFKGLPKSKKKKEFPFVFIALILFIFMIIILNSENGGNNGNRGNRSLTGSILDTIILSNSGRSGGFGGGFGGSSGGGSFGGGGFSGGFGGGGFGGGGASGSW